MTTFEVLLLAGMFGLGFGVLALIAYGMYLDSRDD